MHHMFNIEMIYYFLRAYKFGILKREKMALLWEPKQASGGVGIIYPLDGRVVHASEFIPGSVTFVGNREPGIWEMGSICTCSLRGS